MDVVDDNPPDNARVTQTELDSLIEDGPLRVPDTEPDKLKWLLYRTNQIGDFFASDGTDGDPTAGGYDGDAAAGQEVQDKLTEMANNPALARLQDHHALDDNDVGDDNNDGDLGVIRESSYLSGIGAIAGLYQTFEHAAKRQITLAVVIDRVEEDEGHDDFSGPDFGHERGAFHQPRVGRAKGREHRGYGHRHDHRYRLARRSLGHDLLG